MFDALESGVDPAKVRLVRAPCMGRCDPAPVAEIGHYFVDHATRSAGATAVDSGRRDPDIPSYETLAEYRTKGGYSVLERCRNGTC